MKKIIIFLLMFFLCIPLFTQTPKNVILFIGDGMGLSLIDLARIVLKGNDKYLNFEKAPTVGLTKTYCADNLITDSAAAGTAIACGHKTKQYWLGVDRNNKHVLNLVEIAHAMNKKTGVITNVTVTHATPAAFLFHGTNRRNECEIAEQYLENNNIDLILGGGKAYFLPSTDPESQRYDERNLLQEFQEKNFNVVLDKHQLAASVLQTKKILGVFYKNDLPYAIDYPYESQLIPTLSEMTSHAIQYLSKHQNGFFLMVESGKIDWAMHAHDAGSAIQEIAQLEKAYQVALDFLETHPDTLILVTADHETSGMGLGTGRNLYPQVFSNQKMSVYSFANMYLKDNMSFRDVRQLFQQHFQIDQIENKDLETIFEVDSKEWYMRKRMRGVAEIIAKQVCIGFTTSGHTGQSVPVYAIGAGHESFSGVYENIAIFQKIQNFLQIEKKE
ncbi:MAG TPA: alkaline phosphatase [Planctomycetota bacterium]|nr:alkaline phosphatase [Planctomycetota bacterium]HRU51009.1 alkaline phosphatase [Planctomycetota bacterium]